MSGRIKKIRQEPQESVNLDEHAKASSFRIKSKYTDNLDIIKNWVSTIESSEKDDQIVPTTKVYWKNPKPAREATSDLPAKEAELPLPEELKNFVNYLLEESRIPDDEVRGYSFSVIKPLGCYSKESIKKSSIINVKQCMAYVSDRFVFFGGSREQLTYKVLNLDQLKEQMGMGGMYMPEKFHENVSENTVNRMDLLVAIANILQINNDTSYCRPHKNGFRDNTVIKKNPLKRYVIVFDVIASTVKVNTILRDKLQMMGNIMGVSPDSQPAKILKSFKPALDEAINTCQTTVPETEPSPEEDVEDIDVLTLKKSSYIQDSDVQDNL